MATAQTAETGPWAQELVRQRMAIGVNANAIAGGLGSGKIYAWEKGSKPRDVASVLAAVEIFGRLAEEASIDADAVRDALTAAAASNYPQWARELGHESAAPNHLKPVQVDFEDLIKWLADFDTYYDIESDDLFEQVVIGALRESLGQATGLRPNRHEVRVSTSVLYQAIVDQIESCDTVDIIDQDVLRWNELVNEDDPVSFNTFNYSRDILDLMIDRASQNTTFKARRVFVMPDWLIDEQAPDDDDHRRSLRSVVLNILKYLDLEIGNAGVAGQLENRAWVVPSRGPTQKALKARLAEKVMDVVIVHKGEQAVVMQEEISWRKRQRTLDSASRISAQGPLVTTCTRTFKDLYKIADPLGVFIHELEKKIDGVGS